MKMCKVVADYKTESLVNVLNDLNLTDKFKNTETNILDTLTNMKKLIEEEKNMNKIYNNKDYDKTELGKLETMIDNEVNKISDTISYIDSVNNTSPLEAGVCNG